MKIILKQDIPALGTIGEIKNVAAGYARNYLIPQGFAYPASEANMRKHEHEKRVESQRAQKAAETAVAMKEKIESTSFNVSVQAGEDDKLYGSVTNANIAEALAKHDIIIDKRKIELEEPIKKLGVYTVTVHILPNLNAQAKIWVVKE